jgi:predicted phosphoribosyltransferase
VHDNPSTSGSAPAVAVTVADGSDPVSGAGTDARARPGRPHRPRPQRAAAGLTTGVGRRFADRREAGRALADAVREAVVLGDPVVLGLPRGGVVVAAEVAAALDAPLDVVLVRKLGLPEQPELAMGAIAAAGGAVETVRTVVVLRAGVDDATFDAVRDRELAELRRREDAYRGGREPIPLRGRDVVLVDDGLATGATMRAAVAAVRRQDPASLTVAVPVGSPRVCAELQPEVDRVVCLDTPAMFRAVGQAYRDFSATEDAEVVTTLDTARTRGR